MVASTRFILVRHGETEANRTYSHIGSSDLDLNEKGRAQAEELAQVLAPLSITTIYSSPLRRAVQTATPIAEHHKLPLQLMPSLREGNYGAWELLTRAEIIALNAQNAEAIGRWDHDSSFAPPGGESLDDIHRRVSSTLEDLVHMHADQTIVLVSHVGPIKAVLCTALAAPVLSAFRIFLDPATISIVDWSTRGPLVRLINGRALAGQHQAHWLS